MKQSGKRLPKKTISCTQEKYEISHFPDQNFTFEISCEISFGILSVADKNILRYDNTTSKWKNTAVLTTAENTIYNLTYLTGILKIINSVTNRVANVTNYVDGTVKFITFQ